MKQKRFRERINEAIRTREVRVIDEDGKALGIMQIDEARRAASSRGLDLVEISPNSKPPVCKIIDYGKFNYERQKKEKLAKKHQHVMQLKEIRFNPNTDIHDLEFKTKHLREFLLQGHKVKAYVMFKGRMITHPEIGEKLMQEIVKRLEDISKIEVPPKMEGKQLFAYFTPDKNKIKTFREKQSKQPDESEKEDQSKVNLINETKSKEE